VEDPGKALAANGDEEACSGWQVRTAGETRWDLHPHASEQSAEESCREAARAARGDVEVVG
jgi:hypothetical protein